MRQTLLLVEDNPYDLELSLIAIRRCNLPLEETVVRDGEEAINYLLSKGRYEGRAPVLPSLILLDLKLPKIEGIEVLKNIRSTPLLAHIPIIVLSSSALETDINRARVLGIADYLVKPIDWQGFSQVLCKTLSLNINTDDA